MNNSNESASSVSPHVKESCTTAETATQGVPTDKRSEAESRNEALHRYIALLQPRFNLTEVYADTTIKIGSKKYQFDLFDPPSGAAFKILDTADPAVIIPYLELPVSGVHVVIDTALLPPDPRDTTFGGIPGAAIAAGALGGALIIHDGKLIECLNAIPLAADDSDGKRAKRKKKVVKQVRKRL